MDKDESRSVADHVRWCLEERDRLSVELGKYKSGELCIGERRVGETALNNGTLTHILFLQHNIVDLSRIIDAFDPPGPSL